MAGLASTRSNLRIWPLSRMSGSSSVSPFSMVDRVMLWRIMFMMQIDQTVPLES